MSTTPYSIYMKSNLRVIIYSNVFLSAVMVQNKQRPRRHLAVTNAKASPMTPLGFRSCPLLYFFRRKQSTLIQKGGLNTETSRRNNKAVCFCELAARPQSYSSVHAAAAVPEFGGEPDASAMGTEVTAGRRSPPARRSVLHLQPPLSRYRFG